MLILFPTVRILIAKTIKNTLPSGEGRGGGVGASIFSDGKPLNWKIL